MFGGEGVAVISFDPQLPNMIHGGIVYVNVRISNSGGAATSVRVYLNSDAIISYNSWNRPILSGESKSFWVSITPADVENRNYSVRIWVAFSDSSGNRESAVVAGQIYVDPDIEVTNISWEGALGGFGGKSTITENDSTRLLFKIHSGSPQATYRGLNASLRADVYAQGLVLSPAEVVLSELGPKGTSGEYAFTIESRDTPPGDYPLTIQVFSGGHVVASGNAILKVTP